MLFKENNVEIYSKYKFVMTTLIILISKTFGVQRYEISNLDYLN